MCAHSSPMLTVMRQRRARVLLRDVVFTEDGIPRLKCHIRPASTVATSDETEPEPCLTTAEPDYAPQCLPSPRRSPPSSSSSSSSCCEACEACEPSDTAASSTVYTSCCSAADDRDSIEDTAQPSPEPLHERLARIDEFVARLHQKCKVALDSELRRTTPQRARASPIRLTP